MPSPPEENVEFSSSPPCSSSLRFIGDGMIDVDRLCKDSLEARISSIPLADLADCPHISHHAVGSPFFDRHGQPTEIDPLISLVDLDPLDPALPPATALIVPCGRRPHFSPAPLMQRLYLREKATRDVKGWDASEGLEGIIPLGEVRVTEAPDALPNRLEKLILVSTYSDSATAAAKAQALTALQAAISALPCGATVQLPVRLPLESGDTGAFAFSLEELPALLDTLGVALYAAHPKPHRRLILLTSEREVVEAAQVLLLERALLLTLLDKLALGEAAPPMSYGLADTRARCSTEGAEKLSKGILSLEAALTALLIGSQEHLSQALNEALTLCPSLGAIYPWFHQRRRREGLLMQLCDEAARLVQLGRQKEAARVGRALLQLQPPSAVRAFSAALNASLLFAYRGELAARLEADEYQRAQHWVDAIEADPLLKLIFDEDVSSPLESSEKSALQGLIERSKARRVEAIREELLRRLINPRPRLKAAAALLQDAAAELDEVERGLCPLIEHAIKAQQLNATSRALPAELEDYLKAHYHKYSLYHRRLARRAIAYSIQSDRSPKRALRESYQALLEAHRLQPSEPKVLAMIGLIALTQGSAGLSIAERLFSIWGLLLREEERRGPYRDDHLIHPLRGDELRSPQVTRYAIRARAEREKWVIYVRRAESLSRYLIGGRADETLARIRYRQLLSALEAAGAYQLAALYDQLLGRRWLSLMSSGLSFEIKIPVGFTELPLTPLLSLSRQFRRWVFARRSRQRELVAALEALLKTLEAKLSN
ncbi:MAG: hypothetical protein VYD19_05465 [Myxococcota bacterium]|nr:hypothetical protein [Myxococcota bacterium]